MFILPACETGHMYAIVLYTFTAMQEVQVEVPPQQPDNKSKKQDSTAYMSALTDLQGQSEATKVKCSEDDTGNQEIISSNKNKPKATDTGIHTNWIIQ